MTAVSRTGLKVSERALKIVKSDIRGMSVECEKAGGINLSQGVCDLALPSPVRHGAESAMRGGLNHYSRHDGIPELRKAISLKLRRDSGIKADPEKNIVVSCGSTGAFYCACLALLNPGDEVIIFEPYYGYHVNTLDAARLKGRYVKLRAPDWTFDPGELEKAVTPRTRGIMVNTPANPCGKVFTRKELDLIADLAIKHDLFVFTDEIYEYFLYDGRKHISPGSIARIKDRTITISGYSKTFSVTGWRIGYAACHEKWAEIIGYMNDLIYVCAPTPLQAGVAKGITSLPPAFYRKLCALYAGKREKMCSALANAGMHPYVPQGAYYVLADVAHLPGRTAKDKAMHILRKTGVACVPGSAFYHDKGGENLVRFCFAKDDKDINEACRRLQKLARR
jgi:aminotransferase